MDWRITDHENMTISNLIGLKYNGDFDNDNLDKLKSLMSCGVMFYRKVETEITVTLKRSTTKLYKCV